MDGRSWVAGSCAFLASTTLAVAQPAQPPNLTLATAIQYALDHYPGVQAAAEQVAASTAGVDIARGAYLPRLDGVWQMNRATANNVFGQVLPQAVIPAMSGPVLASATADTVWGSAAGALFSWEAVDFGFRRATVAGAEAALARARAGESLTRLEAAHAAGLAFLNVVAAERAVIAARADAERREQLGRAVHTLVDNQLRPGADASRADADRAAADTREIQAEQSLAIARAGLSRLLGLTADVQLDVSAVIERVPSAEVRSPANPAAHPLALARHAAFEQARAQTEILDHTDRPRLFVQSSMFARGTGANPDGSFDGGANGLQFERGNWAAGLQLVLPNAFDFSTLRARKAAASATTRAEAALYDESLLTVTTQQRAAAATLDAARRIAANTPVQLEAARLSEAQARARYDAGLANIIDVAEAQNLLAQAEVQDQLARVDVWRALLAAAVAHGDLAPVVNLVRQP